MFGTQLLYETIVSMQLKAVGTGILAPSSGMTSRLVNSIVFYASTFFYIEPVLVADHFHNSVVILLLNSTKCEDFFQHR